MYLERFKLTGQTAVITGGGRSIGLACADALAEAGATVVIADHDPEIARSGLEFLRNKGHDARAEIVDVTDAAAVEALAEKLVSSMGRVDILISNAGIARSGTARGARQQALA